MYIGMVEKFHHQKRGKSMSDSTQDKVKLKQLLKKSTARLEQLLQQFPENLDDLPVDTVKKCNAINSTIRLIQAQQRLNDKMKLAGVSLVSSIIGSGVFSLIFARLFS